MFTVRNPLNHSHRLAVCSNLLEAVQVKTLLANRYGFESAIFDQDDYLVSFASQNEALEEVYEKCRVRNPLSGLL